MSRPDNIKRKEVWFTPSEWEIIEQRAKQSFMKTGTYIKTIALRGEIHTVDMKAMSGVESALRSIGNNINQLAKKANEINNIYAGDIEKLKLEVESIFHTLNQYLCTLR